MDGEMKAAQPAPDFRPPNVEVTEDLWDPAWDEFLDGAAGGSYLQSSAWARVKNANGWTCVRIVLRRDNEPVGGCQLLLKSIGRLGSIAYVPRGPVLSDHGASEFGLLVETLSAVLREKRARYLKLQPPTDRADLEPLLVEAGFVPSGLDVAPRATVRVEVNRPLNAVLAALPRRNVRRRIRTVEKAGNLAVRHGTAEDLPAYYELVEATARRAGFTPYPQPYYQAIWSNFAGDGRAALLLVEQDRRLISASLLIAFADSVACKLAVWSGEEARAFPNEFLHWAGIAWAHERGHRYYDFEGVSREFEDAVREGRELPEDGPQAGVARFKLGFGPLSTFPGTYDVSPTPLLSTVVRWAAPRLDRQVADTVAKRLLGMTSRTPWSGSRRGRRA